MKCSGLSGAYKVRDVCREYSTDKETETGTRSDCSLSLKTQESQLSPRPRGHLETGVCVFLHVRLHVCVSVLRGYLQQRLNLSSVQTEFRRLKYDQQLNLKYRETIIRYMTASAVVDQAGL